ncbi:hypothetical protein KRE40_12145 [Elizabethkingia meningoseptica]|uniref:hypothetical protein n=1 Tax=Elizabethkingia meningoseptica TaxID=238 RepID=UPI000AF12785|nr:hypothetical protein [Elizabethkingia meningoseptica]EJK5329804.1 hypothetical protein [Elizabethkingia meningoseptica]MDE5439047.1 hypothetical protein [Elizabethkingia meningoseptica]MDE5468750.1 hypothetical protein [Elizabethkingia meningoseptica]MDE5476063.1 hypothetical protein [Elizabethkingia meningoseptica]MDE5478998.1 hypothetical protein [Elizabethkingia meningoseptica]
MNTFRFRFNNGKKTSTILFWFFATLLAVSLASVTIVLLPDSRSIFPVWLLLIFFPLMLVAIYRLFKATTEKRSNETISFSEKGFTSSCFGAVLFSEIHSIRVPVKEIGLLGGLQYEYYKKTDNDMPNLEFSITTKDGKILTLILNEWGGLYNSQEDFSIFFNFLTALTDHLYQLYHSSEPYKSYLKILNEEGFWNRPG